jgi:hypothetical protein
MADHGIDDMEYVEEFNLDPSLAYTPDINDAVDEVVAKMNEAAEKAEEK